MFFYRALSNSFPYTFRCRILWLLFKNFYIKNFLSSEKKNLSKYSSSRKTRQPSQINMSSELFSLEQSQHSIEFWKLFLGKVCQDRSCFTQINFSYCHIWHKYRNIELRFFKIIKKIIGLFMISGCWNNLFPTIEAATNYFATWLFIVNNRIFEYMSTDKSLIKAGTTIKTGRFRNTIIIKKYFIYMCCWKIIKVQFTHWDLY